MSNISEFEEVFGPPSFTFNDPAYAQKVFGDLYKDIVETCYDRCVQHPAGPHLSGQASICMRNCTFSYYEVFTSCVTANAKRMLQYDKYGPRKFERTLEKLSPSYKEHGERQQIYIPPDADRVDNARQRELERVKEVLDTHEKPLWARGIEQAHRNGGSVKKR